MARTKNAAGDAPILDLAIRGDVVACADGDGRVQTWRFAAADGAGRAELTPLAILHDDEANPITALAATETGFVGAGAELVSWDAAGKVLAKKALHGVATNVVVRGDAVYVLAGGKLLAFTLPKLVASGTWTHAKGVTCELDVDDAGTRALVIRDKKHVELIDLAKKKSLADWTRKGNVAYASARFAKKGTVLAAFDGEKPLSRVKDVTGRITGEIFRLNRFSNGPIVLDRARTVAAVGGAGEDVEVLALDPPRPLFYLDPMITVDGQKSLAGMKRIPTFAQLAPGFFVRHGSVEAPPSPSTLSAIAVGDGGGVVAAGFVSGDVVVCDTKSGAIVSTQRGTLAEGRCRACFAADEVNSWVEVDGELWLLRKDGRICVVDLAQHTMREGPTLASEEALGAPWGKLSVTAETITWISMTRAVQWSRRDGARLAARDLPENKGFCVDGGRVLVLPTSSLGHEGFDLVALDLVTGESKVAVHFDRDAGRFPLGNDPHGWVRLGLAGTQPILTIWAGKGATVAREFAFDLASGTLGRELLGRPRAEGELVAMPEFSNPLVDGDHVRISSVTTGEEIFRCPYEPGDRPRTGSTSAAVDPTSKNVVARVSDSLLAVWRPGARRLVIHDQPHGGTLVVRAKSLVVFDRFSIRLWDITGP